MNWPPSLTCPPPACDTASFGPCRSAPHSNHLDREPADPHLDLVLLAKVEPRALQPPIGQSQLGNLAAVSPAGADGARANAARPGVLPALPLALAAGLDVERFGDGRRTAGLAEGGLAVGALMLGEDVLALVGEAVDEAVVEGAGGIRQAGSGWYVRTWSVDLLFGPGRGGGSDSVASVCRSRLGLTRPRREPASRFVDRSASWYLRRVTARLSARGGAVKPSFPLESRAVRPTHARRLPPDSRRAIDCAPGEPRRPGDGLRPWRDREMRPWRR